MFKNINKVYDIKDILNDGNICLNDKKIKIYKIYPENILGSSFEYIDKLYKSYLSYLRSFPNIFQIVIVKEPENFEKQIKEYNNKILYENNDKLKNALKKYIEYLKRISETEKIYTSNYFLVAENSSTDEFLNIVNNLAQFGAKIKEVRDKKQVESILKYSLNKRLINE